MLSLKAKKYKMQGRGQASDNIPKREQNNYIRDSLEEVY